jgi:diaminopimelate decarboxylase
MKRPSLLRHSVDGVSLADIASSVQTPTYVYSQRTIEEKYAALAQAFAGYPTQICFSVKACSTLGVLRVLQRAGAGFDIVSAGELARVTRVGAAANAVVFSGVGKRDDELVAALDAGILCFNVESEDELLRLNSVATQRGVRAPFSLRINPDIDAKTHPSIATGLKTSKFGVPAEQALSLYRKSVALKGLNAVGVDCHIGSQVTSLRPLQQAARLLAELFVHLNGQRGLRLSHIDVGGGLGVRYHTEKPLTLTSYARAVLSEVRPTGAHLILEPGRSLVAGAGFLLTRVVAKKHVQKKTLLVLDAGMNDLLRPALYDAFHPVAAVRARSSKTARYDLVGPVCESTDVLATARTLPVTSVGDLLVFEMAGAYGMSMASHYNTRAKPAEVLVDAKQFVVIRERETIESLMQGESFT